VGRIGRVDVVGLISFGLTDGRLTNRRRPSNPAYPSNPSIKTPSTYTEAMNPMKQV